LQKEFEQSIDIWIDVNKENWGKLLLQYGKSTAKNKIYIASEPSIISGTNPFLKEEYATFNYVLTYDEELIKEVPNAVLFEFGTTWVELDNYTFPEKKFSVSFVCGDKYYTSGHKLRHKIWYKQKNFTVPLDFYISGNQSCALIGANTLYSNIVPNLNNNKTLGSSKFDLFDSMFHICVENVSKKYYFSEKLIDCLLTKSIPVYLGCTNVNEYFNPEGIIIFKDYKELLEKCNNLTVDDYLKRKEAIKENFEKAKKWINWPERLCNKLEELGIK
jgi:hypothetical protein